MILRKIILRGVHLGSVGASNLLKALAINQSVEEIDLSNTELADEGSSQTALLTLAETLEANSKLRILRVSGLKGPHGD